MEKFLRKLYQKFVLYQKHALLEDIKFWFGVKKLKIKKEVLLDFYKNFWKPTFFGFLSFLKNIIYFENPFSLIKKFATDNWEVWYYLDFLRKEKIIETEKKGKVLLLKKELKDFFPPIFKEKEIKKILEKKLKKRIEKEKPVSSLFKFKIKKDYDQLPISQESAIFVAKKIYDYLPLSKKFLFVGDDDFISIIMGLSWPKFEAVVVDVDEDLLKKINQFSKKFNLKIETKKIEIESSKKKLKDKFCGVLLNPVYTERGVKTFMKFGLSHLSQDGGFVFLELGDEVIGNRFLFLQDFFTKNRLIIHEIITDKVYYPYLEVHQEDKILGKRLREIFDEKFLEKNPRLGAALFCFEYIPFLPKKRKTKFPMYTYL